MLKSSQVLGLRLYRAGMDRQNPDIPKHHQVNIMTFSSSQGAFFDERNVLLYIRLILTIKSSFVALDHLEIQTPRRRKA